MARGSRQATSPASDEIKPDVETGPARVLADLSLGEVAALCQIAAFSQDGARTRAALRTHADLLLKQYLS
jgi:hypothetical protein